MVVDIGRAAEIVRTILAELNYRNSTRCRSSRDGTRPPNSWRASSTAASLAAIAAGDLGPAARAIESVRVTLHESHVASASFDGRVIADPPLADARRWRFSSRAISTTRTGGYEYDRRIIEGLRRGGWSVSTSALSTRSFRSRPPRRLSTPTRRSRRWPTASWS